MIICWFLYFKHLSRDFSSARRTNRLNSHAHTEDMTLTALAFTISIYCKCQVCMHLVACMLVQEGRMKEVIVRIYSTNVSDTLTGADHCLAVLTISLGLLVTA